MTDGTLWREISRTLQADVEQGRYSAGDKLPTEAKLAERFSVNRHTIRQALAELHRQGLTHARRGSGVFVTGQAMAYPIGRRVRFHASIEAAGQVPTKDITRLETIAATQQEAVALSLAPGDPVHIWEGVAHADQTPLAYFRSWFPADRLPGLKDALAESRSVTAALAANGIPDYTRHSTEVTAERADAMLSQHLKCSNGAPVLCARSLNVDPSGNPIEVGRTWFAGDRVRLTFGEEL